MVNSKLIENIAIYVLALQTVVFYSNGISIAKLFLVAPFINHKLLLQYLCDKENINSLEGLISKKRWPKCSRRWTRTVTRIAKSWNCR